MKELKILLMSYVLDGEYLLDLDKKLSHICSHRFILKRF